jgi:uncharacterized protein YciI
MARGSLTITSPSFKPGGPISRECALEGLNMAPVLDLAGVPSAAVELTLICHEPAPSRTNGRHHVADDIMRPDHGGELMQRYVLFYESAADVMSKAPPVYPRHLARLKEYRDRGDLLLVGTFSDPQAEGSMAVFGSREAAEEFVRDDPFVNEGVVKAWTLREWDEVAAEI